MSGSLESGRRLRPRPAAANATVAAEQSTANEGVQDNVRRTRAAAKRAAMDESAKPAGVLSHSKKRAVQPAKKRPALTNISNQSNVTTAAPSRVSKESTKSAPVFATADENAAPDRPDVAARVKAEKVPSDSALQASSAAISSLNRRTMQNLYISAEEADQARSDCLAEDPVSSEASGWSNKLSFQDIDNDHSDPQMCSTYATDIYEHLRMAEIKRRPAPNFMESQQDISTSMRGILVDWLVEVAEEYKLVPDTLYFTISYIDRYLSGNVVARQRLQLLGVSCMLIAAKYEEICAPQVEEFCYITDNTYRREEVLEMERLVLNHLKFELTTPTTKSFLRRFIRAAQTGYKVPTLNLEFLGNFLAELTLVVYSFLQYLPSLIAASAVFLAKLTLDPTVHPWDSTLQHYTGYKASELKECVTALHELQCNTKKCTLPAIREKYCQHKFKCVSKLLPPTVLPPEYFCDIKLDSFPGRTES
ncbi:hypothetical protein CY35_18G101000 [Sphagnum magellanicum]|nr:hypothetical protein CY35_18G101000 [Sphagnum magellanicum]